METLKHPHLAPHALLILLDFLLRNRLQCDLAHEVPRGSLARGILRGRGGQRGSGERVRGGGGARRGEARRGWTGCAALGEGLLFWWYVSCPALLMCDDHNAAFVLLEWVYTPERPSHVPRLFQTSQSRGCRGCRTAFSRSLTVDRRWLNHRRHHLLGDKREHLFVVALIVSKPVTMLSLDFQVVSSVEQEMNLPDAEVVRGRERPSATSRGLSGEYGNSEGPFRPP